MGSSWRYNHVTITPYSIRGFHGLPHTFFMGLLIISISRACVLLRWTSRKTKQPNWPAPPLHSIFQPSEPPLYPTRSHLLCVKLNLGVISKIFGKWHIPITGFIGASGHDARSIANSARDAKETGFGLDFLF